MRPHSDWQASWAILWRSLVFLPYMLAVFVSLGCIWLSRWGLPFCAACYLYSRDWGLAAGCGALWLIAVTIYRRLRLARFFETPPSLL